MKRLLSVVFAFSFTAVMAVDEGDFYVDMIDQVDQTVNLVTDYGANGGDTNDDSDALQNAIDAMTALTNGGKIIIPEGTFYLIDIKMKDNVHIVIDPDAVIKAAAGSGTIFRYGYDRKNADAAITVRNVSIRCAVEGEKYTVDYSHCDPNPNKINFVSAKNVQNFMVADFFVKDNWTKISAVTVGQATYNGEYWRPVNGVVKNGDMSRGHYGYGLMQMQVGKKILFKDLAGNGGLTVRLESGAVAPSPDWFNTDSVWVRNVSCTNGHGALMMGPHTKDNGHVDADGVYSYGALYAVGAGGGYVTNEEDSLGYTPGSFANTCIIRNVHAVYGDSAQLKWKNFDEIPCAIRHLINYEPVMDGKIYDGPSSCAAKSTAADKSKPYTITWMNITMEGFEHQFDTLITLADERPDCHPVPVAGMSLSQDTASLVVDSTIQLSALITPVDATDPSLQWESSDTLVATVDTSGRVTGLAVGEVEIRVTATDGGYPDTCKIQVLAAPVTGIPRETISLPERDFTFSVSPNPVSESFRLSMNLKDNGAYTLSTYDITGKLIKEKELGAYTPGLHDIEIYSADLDMHSGIYFIALRNDGPAIYKKILVK